MSDKMTDCSKINTELSVSVVAEASWLGANMCFFFLVPCNQRAVWIEVRVWECVFRQEGGLDGGLLLLHWSSGHSDFKTDCHPLSCIHCCCVALWRAVKVIKLHIFQLFWHLMLRVSHTALLHKYLSFLATSSFRRFNYCHLYFVLILKLIIDLVTFMSFSITHF